MHNLIPLQINSFGETENKKDQVLSIREIDNLMSKIFEGKVNRISRRAIYKVIHGDNITFLLVKNITYMGGDGMNKMHPLDLKRIQLPKSWQIFCEQNKGLNIDVKFIGIYKNDSLIIFADFIADTYLKRKMNNSAAHIYLNDLYQGLKNGIFSKIDKRGNKIFTISEALFRDYIYKNAKENVNPILRTIEKITDTIKWNEWIRADEAIQYERSLFTGDDDTSFNNWKQNMWNGWYVEAKFSHYQLYHPNIDVIYVDTCGNRAIKEKFKKYDLDLVFPKTLQNDLFMGDIKAVSTTSGGNTLLNDVAHTDLALKDFGKIWICFYLHDKLSGSTNNFEMVEWRNKYIYEQSGKKGNLKLRSARNTPHSIKFTDMVILELNSVNKDNFFKAVNQFGHNSNGKERNKKYSINKNYLKKLVNDDSLVIYRYKRNR